MDTFGRTHSDLRISVTDRCNIRCFYCMPETGAEFAKAADLLTFDEIERFVRVAVPLGIRRSGYWRRALDAAQASRSCSEAQRLSRVRDLALTTNGVLLAEAAQPLHDAGLRRLNIHLDTLDRERFRQITRRDDFGRVMAGFKAAKKCGYEVVKLNAVAIKGLTEPDVVSLVRFGRENDVEVRFVEFMPLDAQDLWSWTVCSRPTR